MVFIFIEKYTSGELIAQQISHFMIIHYVIQTKIPHKNISNGSCTC